MSASEDIREADSLETAPVEKRAGIVVPFAMGVGRSVLVGLRSFAISLFLFGTAGMLCAGGGYYFLHDRTLPAVLAVVLTLVETLAMGMFIGGKRAFIRALVHGLHALRLGRAAVRLIFERLLAMRSGGAIARVVERIPLGQAEAYLSDAIHALLSTPPEKGGVTGWFRRRLRAVLLLRVQKYTLARFREEDAREGGIDLARVQQALEDRIDDLLAARLRGGLNLWTGLGLLGLVLLSAGQTYLILVMTR